MGNWDVSKPNNDGERELIDRAVKALEAEPCDDAISRQEALDVIAETDITNGTEPVFTGKQVQALLRDLPSVTPKQRTGHWIRQQIDDYHSYYECEHCGIAVGLDDIKNYCPNCGAKMVDPQESEEISREEIAALLAREGEEQA